MARRLGTAEGYGRYFDFSRGIVGGISDYGNGVRHLREADNLLGGPLRAIGSSRLGSSEAQASAFDIEPEGIALYIPDTGLTRVFAHCKTGLSGVGACRSIQAGTPGIQTIAAPGGFTVTDSQWSMDQLNNALICCQPGDTQLPLMFHRYGGGGTYALESLKLVAPVAAPTLAATALTGGVDVGDHWYRCRYRYRNGASVASPVSVKITVAINVEKVTVTLPTPLPTIQDFVGWTIERTKLGAPSSGGLPTSQAHWYWVADGTAATYDDVRHDADLVDVIDDGLFGDPPHLEGVIARKDRLYGWAGSTLYVSQAMGDAQGTGICNWDPDLAYQIGQDDGDIIVAVCIQADRLLIWKYNSIHPFEGDDPDGFRTYQLAAGVGCVAPRAVAAHGAIAWALGEHGYHMVAGNQVNPGDHRFGEIEVGHYLERINTSARTKSWMLNLSGELLLLWIPLDVDVSPAHGIVYDFRTRRFWHITQWTAAHALLQRKGTTDFGGSRMLFADWLAKNSPGSADFSLNPSASVWIDPRTNTQQAFVQIVNNLGASILTTDGLLIGTATVSTLGVDIVSDGFNGWIIVYAESRGVSHDVFAQRINAAGAKLWGASGISVGVAAGTDTNPSITADGTGGCFIFWTDGTANQNRGQHLDLNGAALWAAGGVLIGSVGDSLPSRAVYDGTSLYLAWARVGAIVVHKLKASDGSAAVGWSAINAGSKDSFVTVGYFAGFCTDGAGNILVPITGGTSIVQLKKITAGATTWTSANLEAVQGSVVNFRVLPDGQGGAFVTWGSVAAGGRPRAARVNSTGATVWGPIYLAPAIGAQPMVSLDAVLDGSGGFIVTWAYNAPAPQVMAQRVSAAGATQWGTAGVLLRSSTAIGQVQAVRICTDGSGGAIVNWQDFRGVQADIYAQRVNPLGVPLWTENGALICGAIGAQFQNEIAFTSTPANGFPATALGYRFWRAFTGELDDVGFDGTGGDVIPIRALLPWIDDGAPDAIKELERIEVEITGDGGSMTASIGLDQRDAIASVSVPLEIVSSATLLGNETDTIDPDDWQLANEDGSSTGIVGKDYLSGDATQNPFSGLPLGTFCRRYNLEIVGNRDSQVTLAGFVVDGLVSPERPY